MCKCDLIDEEDTWNIRTPNTENLCHCFLCFDDLISSCTLVVRLRRLHRGYKTRDDNPLLFTAYPHLNCTAHMTAIIRFIPMQLEDSNHGHYVQSSNWIIHISATAQSIALFFIFILATLYFMFTVHCNWSKHTLIKAEW